MEKVVSPTKAQANLFALIKEVNRDSKPILIASTKEEESAVLISKRAYDAIQETMALALNGELKDTLSRRKGESVDLAELMREIDNE